MRTAVPKRENAPVSETETPETPGSGKGRPTPKRREAEAARKRPLVPADRKEARRQARERMSTEREKARIGMAAGDERYLPERDRGPQRKFVRDYVDARFSIGELMIPVMVVVIILTLVPINELQVWLMLFLYSFVAVVVLDCVVVGNIVRKRIREKVGAERVERGLRWYAAMRSVQLRLLRLPKPQVRRGQRPTFR